MLPSETMIWQPEFTDKTLSRKPGAVHDAGPRCSWRAKHVYLSIPPVCSLHSSILLSYVGHMSALP
ncbi:hypothetical protein GLS30_23330 [Escherichia coli]|nr:hypothetical protein [Escherichia coli]